jgi:RNA polymerase sigma factor (sigma-70 family)
MSRNNNHGNKARALSERYFKELLAFVYTIVQDEELAEEIVSTVFNTIYNNEEICRNIQEPAWGYLAQMARNAWLMTLRKKEIDDRNTTAYNLLYAEQWQASPEEDYIYRELMAQLEQLIRTLPKRMGRAFELLREGHTTREVAEIMGISEQTVRNMKTNAIKVLRDELIRLGLLHLLWLLW